MSFGLPGASRSPSSRWRLITALVVVAALAGTALAYALGLPLPQWPATWTASAFEELIQSWGMWGVAASIGLMVVHSFVPFPAEFVAFANGMVYGPLLGTAITWIGAMLGAYAAFGLARVFGRPLVERMVATRDWQDLDDWLARQGGDAVFISRFLPVVAFNLINYAAGLTRISWWTFTWATGLGILPLTALMVALGHRIETLSWSTWLLLGAAGLVMWLALRAVRGRLLASHARPSDQSGNGEGR